MLSSTPKPGDVVVFSKTKWGRRPGPRAREVAPLAAGDGYSYTVDKFWIVLDVHEDGSLDLLTPGGKVRQLDLHDKTLRFPTLIERLRYRGRIKRLRLEGPEPGADDSAPARGSAPPR